jgi:hypothetical protein
VPGISPQTECVLANENNRTTGTGAPGGRGGFQQGGRGGYQQGGRGGYYQGGYGSGYDAYGSEFCSVLGLQNIGSLLDVPSTMEKTFFLIKKAAKSMWRFGDLCDEFVNEIYFRLRRDSLSSLNLLTL